MTHFIFDAPSVIQTKRDGDVLSDATIDWVIDAYTHGRVADAQMSALLMAILLRGMTRAEIARWTAAMVASGECLDFFDLRPEGTRPSRRRAAAQRAISTRWRWDWRCGGSVRAAPARVSGRGRAPGRAIHRRPGEAVVAGEPAFSLYTDTPERFCPAIAELAGGWSVGDTELPDRPLIIDWITP